MKQPFIIGNWKSHKTPNEVAEWFAQISPSVRSLEATVILCPPFPLLPQCKELIKKQQLPWKLGAQDVSQYPVGKHTGEVSATLLKEFVEYVLIGHSERRHMGETDAILFEKVKRVQEVGITPIFFVQGKDVAIPQRIPVVAYEPLFAIGTGKADTPEDAEKIAHFFKTEKQVPTVLYGGSVDDKNVSVFMSCSSIDGIVPGTASLDPVVFSHILQYA